MRPTEAWGARAACLAILAEWPVPADRAHAGEAGRILVVAASCIILAAGVGPVERSALVDAAIAAATLSMRRTKAEKVAKKVDARAAA